MHTLRKQMMKTVVVAGAALLFMAVVTIFMMARGTSAASLSDIVINEVAPNAGSSEKWVELYNKGKEPVNISALRLYRGTTGTALGGVTRDSDVLEPGGYHVITFTHSFPLNSGGSPVLLYSDTLASGQEIDRVDWGVLQPGESYGRSPDGSSDFRVFSEPTRGAANPYDEPVPPVQVAVPGGVQITSGGTVIPSGATTRSNSLVLSWRAVEGAIRYEVRIAAPGGGQPEILEVQGTSFDAKEKLSANGSYQFSVRAVGDETTSDWSAPYTINYDTIPVTPPPTVAITTPNDAISHTTPLVIRGTASGASKVRLTFVGGLNNETITREVPVVAGVWEFIVTRDVFAWNGLYTLTVEAQDGQGNTATSTRRFTLIDPDVVIPTPQLPIAPVPGSDDDSNVSEHDNATQAASYQLPGTLAATQQRVFSMLDTQPVQNGAADAAGETSARNNDILGDDDEASQTGESDGSQAWVWWIIGGTIVVVVGGGWLMVRSGKTS